MEPLVTRAARRLMDLLTRPEWAPCRFTTHEVGGDLWRATERPLYWNGPRPPDEGRAPLDKIDGCWKM